MRLLPLLCACAFLSASAQRPAPVKRPSAATGYVAIDGGRLYYESAGTGPVVVLINGANLDARMWDAQFSALASTHRVVRYDERGFGRSTAADVPYAAEQDLATLLDSLHITRASLVGLSLGGRIALDFTLAHPAAVDQLVLASPGMSGWRFAPDDTAWVASLRSAMEKKDSVAMARSWLLSDWMKPAMQQPRLQPVLRELIVASAGNWMGLVHHGSTEHVADPPALGRTKAIRARTLVIVGDHDVPDILRIADTLVATIPNATRVVLPGAGHVVNLEQPDRFNAALLTFLRR